MDFALSPRAEELRTQLEAFMDARFLEVPLTAYG